MGCGECLKNAVFANFAEPKEQSAKVQFPYWGEQIREAAASRGSSRPKFPNLSEYQKDVRIHCEKLEMAPPTLKAALAYVEAAPAIVSPLTCVLVAGKIYEAELLD